jgi:hypothetical protein
VRVCVSPANGKGRRGDGSRARWRSAPAHAGNIHKGPGQASWCTHQYAVYPGPSTSLNCGVTGAIQQGEAATRLHPPCPQPQTKNGTSQHSGRQREGTNPPIPSGSRPLWSQTG